MFPKFVKDYFLSFTTQSKGLFGNSIFWRESQFHKGNELISLEKCNNGDTKLAIKDHIIYIFTLSNNIL